MEKYQYSVASSEMKRRWQVTLSAMEQQGIDCLILYATVGKFGGAMMYLTDVFAAGSYPHCAVFSRDGIFLIGHGNKNGTMSPRNVELLNIAEDVGLPITPSMCYADTFYPAEMARIIKKHHYARIGFVGMSYIPASVYKYLTETLPQCDFVDATDMVDRIHAVKSDYEIEMWKRGIRTIERVFAAIPSILRPGRSEAEVVHEVEYVAKTLGCPVASIMIGADPLRPVKSPILYRNHVIGPHDYINFLLELAVPGGIWGELGRVFSFDEPSSVMRQAERDANEIQAMIAENSKPGASPSKLLALVNQELTKRGYNPELRIFAHSQGYDIVERPVYSEWETMALEENMLVAIHPTCSNKNVLCSNTDNFLIRPEGAQRLNSVKSGIVVIG